MGSGKERGCDRNGDDQTSSTCPSLLYISPIVVSGWGRTTYTKFGKHIGSEETTRCIQRRVSVRCFLTVRSKWIGLRVCYAQGRRVSLRVLSCVNLRNLSLGGRI